MKTKAFKWKPGATGFYVALDGIGPVIKARVLRAHRDGTVTVQALWTAANEGRFGCFIGYKYRLEARHLLPVNPVVKPRAAAIFRRAFELGLHYNPETN